MVDVDLHLHTNYSDGIESPEAVVRRAKSLGLNVIAITDHDGVGGVKAAQSEGKKLGVKVISGIEFSAEFFCSPIPGCQERHRMHILGYDIDLSNPGLVEKMEKIIQKRVERNEKMREAFCRKGIQITDAQLKENSPSGYVGKVSFARVLVKMGLIENTEEAFIGESLMRSPDIKSIRKDKIDAKEAIRIILEAGGKPFLAHPFQLWYTSLWDDPDNFRKRLLMVVENLKAIGLQGLECYYPTHDPEQTEYLLGLADEMNLLVSIGSDDHGPEVREIKKIHSFQVDVDIKRLSWAREIR